jgi:NADH-quinone oxidoreductase subunit M
VTIHLSIVLWLPLAFGVLGLVLGARAARLTALLGAALTLAYAIVLLADFRAGGGLQYVTDLEWIPQLGIHYKLGVDGINVVLILLTAVLWLASTLWVARERRERAHLFLFWLAMGETGVLGALMAQDLALFVVFFDLMLVPFMFLTFGWGGPGRGPATLKFFIYTLVGSLLMLTGAIATGAIADTGGNLSFALSDLAERPLPEGSQSWIFLFFAAAFLVKMPMFPLHGWMPDAYRTMPLPALAVFSAVLSKVAAYGFLKIALPLYPAAAGRFQELLLLVGLAGILYGSVMAFTTTQTRLILGYSSIAQLGFIVLGIFALNGQGAQGALLQSVNHGIVVAPAFFIVWLLAARAGGSEDLRDMSGLAFRAPVLATLFLVVAMANLAIPGSANFVGEFLILLGVFETKIVIAIVASTGVALAAVYTLRLFIGAMHNRVGERARSTDLAVRDGLILVPLVVTIVALALYPQLPLEKSEDDVVRAVQPAAQALEPDAQAATGQEATP